MGRLFDAVAALAGVRDRVSHEGQAAGRVRDGIRRETGLLDVVLSGGVFMYAILFAEAHARLTAEGFRPHRHPLVPPNERGGEWRAAEGRSAQRASYSSSIRSREKISWLS